MRETGNEASLRMARLQKGVKKVALSSWVGLRGESLCGFGIAAPMNCAEPETEEGRGPADGGKTVDSLSLSLSHLPGENDEDSCVCVDKHCGAGLAGTRPAANNED